MSVLAKDCDCITHDGPCWLHMDELWHEKNRQILREAQKLTARGQHHAAMFRYEAFRREEIARLQEKAYQMRRYGLTEIPTREGGEQECS